jgi:hypothetical protein
MKTNNLEIHRNDSKFEELGRDASGNMSSRKTIWSGKNSGWKRPELKKYKWVYVGGYTYDSSSIEIAVHHRWAHAMVDIGMRIGTCETEGTISFYILQKKSPSVDLPKQ